MPSPIATEQLIKSFFYGAGLKVMSNGTGSKAPTALIQGGGTNADPILLGTTQNVNGFDFRMKSTATAGTTRGRYERLYLSGGAGGETYRAFTTVEDDTPDDTCNGAHISLNFGSSAGNISGLGTASRHTLHIPNRSLGGTTAALMAEVWADGSSSAVGGTTSNIRAAVGGDATGVGNFEDNGFFIEFAGFTAGSGNIIGAAGNEPTWTSKTVLIRCKDATGTLNLVAVRP